ncbi:glycosyltransferase [Asaia spathodeae NBRC 105894]|uniref:Autotransporter strand-loop-strand O-heptosyltransferase n=1 Tax=Asaia spathodeae TaxID=657016 RepID=A0ABX2P5B8_9PROT|nr:glycosyltransferase [Asaia spathodeae NBRC 105894]
MGTDEQIIDREVESKPPSHSCYLPPSTVPTIAHSSGIRFDFNAGARVSLPARGMGEWCLTLSDLDSGNIIFRHCSSGSFITSTKRYFNRFHILVEEVDETGARSEVLSHAYDCAGKIVVIQMPVSTLGDALAWFPYAARFGEIHGATVVCIMDASLIALLADNYPEIRFLTLEEARDCVIMDDAYASYSLGLFFDDPEFLNQPTDFRQVGLHKTAAYILGVTPEEIRPVVSAAEMDTPPIDEPYICIATQASTQCKYWNNPEGWLSLVSWALAQGYRVICIDKSPFYGAGIMWNRIPHGAEDQTGDRPLSERVRWLRHASAFVGLSSGLSWLAWASGTPVVMISGFTHPTNEFETEFRVINWHACNSCWNDATEKFDHHDFLWCPRHKNTERQFECTRLITPGHVIKVLNAALHLKNKNTKQK